MKKSIKLTTLAMTALMAASVSAPAFAADAATPSIGQTKGTVNVTKGDDSTPTNPSDPGDDQPGGTGNTGDLALVAVPDLDFGTVKIGDQGPATLQESKATNKQHHVETKDARGTGAGWTLSVKYGTENDDKTSSTAATAGQEWALTGQDGKYGSGFKLALSALDYDNPETTATGVNQGTKPDSAAISEVNDSDQTVASAKNGNGQGMGNWIGNYATKTGATLTVPSNNLVGDYTANLVWTLSDTPEA